MDFQVIALGSKQFAPYFDLSDEELASRGVIRYVADRQRFGRMPCRVSLIDANDGDSVLLLHHEHQTAKTPYRSGYAIYVRERVARAKPGPSEIPQVMQARPLSVRAFDARGMLRDACLAEGSDVAATLASMLASREIAYLHVHNAKHGCYVAQVVRAAS